MTISAKISEHFTYNEMTQSATAYRLGINNNPDREAYINLCTLCDDVLEPVREEWGKALRINSGYRCTALNKAVGGSPRSYHIKGMAADIHVSTSTQARALAALFLKNKLVDLVLNERNLKTGGRWLHVQWSPVPRHEYKEITV